MKSFKKILPIFIFSALFIAGIIITITSFRKSSYDELENFFNGSDFMKSSIFDRINWIGLAFIILGFFGNVICIASFIYKNKVNNEQKTKEDEFNNKIRKAFSSVNDNSKDSDTVICPYCKCKYKKNSSKCPNCGAPPEPCD